MRKNVCLWAVCLWALALLACGTSAMAQEFRANLTGQVTDPSGALIRNAEVSAVNVDSGTTYTGKTTDKGVYYIPYVLPGTYTVTASADGFKTAQQDKVLMLASQTFNQNFKLEVGSVSEKVVVNTAPAELETSTGSGGTVIDQREIQSVPLNGGVAYNLIGTTTGSQFTTTHFGNGGTHGTTGYDTSNAYTIGGGVVGNNQFTLNGTNITSQFTYDNHAAGEWNVSPNLDSIEEVNVMTTTYDARYGRTSGGTINTVGKSGGNQFHGNARYAYQGAFMNANSYQNNLTDTPRQGGLQNQFWITAGGPVIKNKLFFFFGFEGYRQSLSGSILENTPPAYLRPNFNGTTGVNFSNIQTYDSAEFPNGLAVFQPGTASCLDGGAVTACNSNHVVQTQFAGNAIPASQINATAAAVLNYIPLPNIAGAVNLAKGYNYLAITPNKYAYNQPQIRLDYNLSDKTKLYSFFLYWRGTQNQSSNGLEGIAENGSVNHTKQNFVATQDLTHVFSPSLIGDFKVSFNRFYETSPDGDLEQQTDPGTIGLTMPLPAITSARYLPEFSVTDGWGTGFLANNPNGDSTIFGNQGNPDVTNTFTFDVDFTKTAGAHTLEFGGEIDEFQYGGYPDSGGHPNGSFSFNSGWTQLNPHNSGCYPIVPQDTDPNSCVSNSANGSALASFYLGYPGSGSIDWIGSIMEGYPVYAGYFQDNWRVNSRLTLNLGIRYDVQRGLRERHNNLNRGLCLTCVNPLTNEAEYQANVANGANQAAWTAAGISPSSLDTVYGGIEFAGTNGQSRDAYNTDWSDVGPRIGFAFVVDPKTVIRGGWGLMYSYGLEGGSSVGEAQTTSLTTSTDGNNTPTNYFQSGNPFYSGLLAPTGSSAGLLTDVGNGGVQVDFPNRKIPMEQILSLGFQRELPGQVVLDARYAGNFTSRLRISTLWLNGTATLAEQQAAQANTSVWTQQVPNPYYGVPGMDGPGECGTNTTVQAIVLDLPYSQYCGGGGGAGLVGQYNSPQGRNWYNGLEVKLSRRVTNSSGKGASFQLAYTYSKTMSRDGYLNGWPYQDPEQQHDLASTDRTHVLSVTSVYDLPFGQGGLFFNQPNPFVGRIISGWTLSGVFNVQSGTPVGIDNGDWYTCPNVSYRPSRGTSVGAGRWLNNENSAYNTCWQSIPQYGLMNLHTETNEVRNPTIPSLDLSLQKNTKIRNSLNLQLRLDAFNALNSVLFGGPDTTPGDGPPTYTVGSGWSGFGTVGPEQQNFPRVLQVGGNITF
ncbi:carboxypeptidase regulatory-like domain-containing protein [Silvibacterium sp.]|uniref:TonB-dependent receptor n=1 Tax=Silvibacterium sp. TaxID=1964179 RepID=UPI0039E30FEB